MRKIKYALTAVLIILLIFIISALFDIAGIGGGSNPIDIKITDGSGNDAVAKTLKDAGVVGNKTLFKIYASLTGEHIYQKGTHSLNSSMSFSEIINMLERMPDSNYTTVLIPEGYELRQIADTLESAGLVNREVFIRETEVGNFNYGFLDGLPNRENRLEGYLYPDTYVFADDVTEHEIIDIMLSNFEKNVIPVYELAQSSQSLDDILKLASVIEREAANDEERATVASVFVNRLNIGMKLESCATVQYLLKERKSVLSNEDIQIDSPYNTYKNSGLPIGPIASPGIKSIEAALYPADTTYVYFMAAADGSHSIFAETYEQHLENQQLVQGE